MWKKDRDERGFWAVSGGVRVGPFIRSAEMYEYMRTHEPPEEVREVRAKRRDIQDIEK